jgi:hypothetical protein
VRVLRQFVSIALLLAILPATLHCDLEKSGLLADAGHCCSSESSGRADVCDTLESKGLRFKKDDLLVAPRIALPAPEVFLMRSSVPLTALIHFNPADLLEHQRPWQFVQRTASLARSPSILA